MPWEDETCYSRLQAASSSLDDDFKKSRKESQTLECITKRSYYMSVTAVSPYVMASSQSCGSCNQYSVVGVNPATSRFLVPPWNEQGGHRLQALMKYGTSPFPLHLNPSSS